MSEPLFLPNSPGATEWLGEEQEDDGWLASFSEEVFLSGPTSDVNLALLVYGNKLNKPLALKPGSQHHAPPKEPTSHGPAHFESKAPGRLGRLQVWCTMETLSAVAWCSWMLAGSRRAPWSRWTWGL